jgi:hypothetical protein
MPVCQVCGTEIAGAPRLCERCDTPHHADCWEYTGRCSVYGCMSLAATAVVEAAAGGTSPALARSAARVAPIVPVPGSPGAPRWIADETGCWIGGYDQRVITAPGERVVVLPPAPALQLADQAGVDSALARMPWPLTVAGVFAVFAARTILGPPAVFIAMALVLLAAAAARAHCTPEIAWLARDAKGLWLHGIRGARCWNHVFRPDEPPLAMHLERSYETEPGTGGRTALTFKLGLKRLAGHRPAPLMPLAPPLYIPHAPEARRLVLEQLVAYRALGQHMATLLELPFHEGVSQGE